MDSPSFDKIKDFFSFRSLCPFCNKKLKIILINFVGSSLNEEPILYATHRNNSFNVTNNFKFQLNTSNNIITLEYPDNKFKDRINDFFPAIELFCNNKICKEQYHYSINSDVLPISHLDDHIYLVGPIKIFIESFIIDNLWSQNNYIDNKLYIYDYDFMKNDDENIHQSRLQFDILNIKNYNAEKITKKIKMLTCFS